MYFDEKIEIIFIPTSDPYPHVTNRSYRILCIHKLKRCPHTGLLSWHTHKGLKGHNTQQSAPRV